MPLLAPKYKLLGRIDRDRDKLENLGKAQAARTGLHARRLAYAAWRTTKDPKAVVAVVRAALLGSDHLETPGIVTLLRDGMLAAHLQGWRRTALNVKAHTDEVGIKLSTAYDGAIDFLAKRQSLSEGELTDLSAQYESAALRVVNESTTSLEQAIQQAILDTTQQGGSVADGVSALRKAFEAEGFVPGADYQLEAIFRTQVQTAYHAGRWSSLNDPKLDDLLWGFEYSSIHDDRVTHKICEPLDGMTRPKDDEVWTRLWPPNHWNCRSTPLEIFGEGNETDVPAGVEAQDGFGFNPGMVFGSGPLALAIQGMSLAFDPSKHPRRSDGKFGAGGGGKTPKAQTASVPKRSDITPVSKKNEAKIKASFTGEYHPDAYQTITRMHKWSQQASANRTLLAKESTKHNDKMQVSLDAMHAILADHQSSLGKVDFKSGTIEFGPSDKTPEPKRFEAQQHMKAAAVELKKIHGINERVAKLRETIRQKAFDEITKGHEQAVFPTHIDPAFDAKKQEVFGKGIASFQKLIGGGANAIHMGAVERPDGQRDRGVLVKQIEDHIKNKNRSYAGVQDSGIGSGAIHMGKGANAGVVVHELGHAWEMADPEIYNAAVEFRKRRTVGSGGPMKLSFLQPGSGYADHEKALPDKYRDPYTGKVYEQHNYKTTEIVSMGLEYMHNDPVAFAKEDPDHFAFIYTLMKKHAERK